MDKIIQRKQTLAPETLSEFYLCPKDVIISERYNIQFLTRNMRHKLLNYLPLNEVIALVFEDKIEVLDIKSNLMKNMTVLFTLNFEELLSKDKNSIDISQEKTSKRKSSRKKVLRDKSEKLNYDNGYEDKCKNIVFFERKKGVIYCMVERMNLEFYFLRINLIKKHCYEKNIISNHGPAGCGCRRRCPR